MRQISEDQPGQASLVASGALSLCAQMWFQPEVSEPLRNQCGEVLLLLAGATLDDGKLKGQRMSTKLALAALGALGRWGGVARGLWCCRWMLALSTWRSARKCLGRWRGRCRQVPAGAGRCRQAPTHPPPTSLQEAQRTGGAAGRAGGPEGHRL